MIHESETLELKKTTGELKEAVISITAILNKHGRGELYFGIKNDGTIVGQQVTDKTIRDVSQAIANGIEPKIYPVIDKVKIDDKNCIRVFFSADNPPYYAQGRAYMRIGDEDRQMAVPELEKLILSKNTGQLRWDNQTADCTLEDLDPKAVKEFIKKSNEAGRIGFQFQSVESTLKKLRMTKEGKPLRAAQVLFSNQNPLKIQAALFAGVEKLTFLDIQQFERQNLFELLKTSEEYVKKHINWRVKFGKLEREEIPEIPLDALREALVNSLCHRDYRSPQSNYLGLYKDRIEIENPGTFPENLDPEDYIFKNEPSIPRNPLIADALYRTKDIEKWGSGLKRIHDDCKENNVKVEFKKTTTGFRVIFYRPKIADSVTEIKINNNLKLSRNYPETIQKILDALRQKPNLTIAQLATLTGLKAVGVKYHLRKLKKQGKIKRVGPDKGGHWQVQPQNKTRRDTP